MSVNIYEGAPNDKKKWVTFMAHYKVDMSKVEAKGKLDNGKWLDDVEVTWELLYKPEEARNSVQNYIKLSKKVKYKNVGHGKHTAVIFIDPTSLERYFLEGNSKFMRGLKLKFTMKVGGKTVKNMTSYITDAKPDKKAEYAKLFLHEETFKLDGILKNRNETPFKYSQTGYFDQIVEDDK